MSRSVARRSLWTGVALVLAVSSTTLAGAAGAAAPTTTRVSVSSTEQQAHGGDSRVPVISGDGHLVVFESGATDLVAGDTNKKTDIFVRDRTAGTTRRVSVSSGGVQGNHRSEAPSAISANGRYVAFTSYANNLVPGDTNHASDVFVRDLVAGTTQRVSVSSEGTQSDDDSDSPVLTAGGGTVAFSSFGSNLVSHDTNDTSDVFVHNLSTDVTRRVSKSSTEAQGDCGSYSGSISARGRYVAFGSCASDLVRHDTNDTSDVFVRDRVKGTTRRVSVSSDETQANGFLAESFALSSDGRYVTFGSFADNLVKGDTNGTSDVFVRDRRKGTTRLVSVNSAGKQGNSASDVPSISTDGRFVVFTSEATNLTADGAGGPEGHVRTEIYLRDRVAHTTIRVPTNTSNVRPNDDSFWPAMTPNGDAIAFTSVATDLVPGDTNKRQDVFVRDMSP